MGLLCNDVGVATTDGGRRKWVGGRDRRTSWEWEGVGTRRVQGSPPCMLLKITVTVHYNK